MKGRIFVVDEKFIKNSSKHKYIEIIIPKPKNELWFKTITDILADAFQLQINDYAFFWQKKGNNNDNSCIYGIYRVVSTVFYENNVFKLALEEAYHFKNPVSEYEILNDPYNKHELWNIIGKKIAGKSRASSPLTQYEIEYLIQKLIDKNPDYTYNKPSNKYIPIKNGIKINLNNTYKNILPKSLNHFDPNKISYLHNDNSIRYEKFMELLFNLKFYERDNNFFKQLNINIDNVLWYANYLPYSIERKEIDYLILESNDKQNISKINLIEFEIKSIDIDHIKRCLLYSTWLNSYLAKGTNLTQPIIICETINKNFFNKYMSVINKLEDKNRPLQVYTIKYNNNLWVINRVR